MTSLISFNTSISPETRITNLYRGKASKNCYPWTPIECLTVGSQIILPSIYSLTKSETLCVIASLHHALNTGRVQITTTTGVTLLLPVQNFEDRPGTYVTLLCRTQQEEKSS